MKRLEVSCAVICVVRRQTVNGMIPYYLVYSFRLNDWRLHFMILGKWPNWSTICSMYLFEFCTCFGQPLVHHQENQLYQYYLWYMSLCVGDRFVFRTKNNDLHTKRSTTIDIYQRLYWYIWFSWWWACVCSKHVEDWNKYIEMNCASVCSLTKNHNKMRGP
jgi:hypothetical protein